MQNELLPNLPPNLGYENLLTAIDVLSRYPFAYTLTHASAINVANVLIDIMTKHAYPQTTLITDRGSVFTSTINAEITQILRKKIKCATPKHLQTIGKLERTHESLKTNLILACEEYCRQWHNHLSLAVVNNNTSCHASIGCAPTRVNHGRVPSNILDHSLGNNTNEQISPTTEFAEEIQNRQKCSWTKQSKIRCTRILNVRSITTAHQEQLHLRRTIIVLCCNPKLITNGRKSHFGIIV